jgi:hypothetical protein
MKNNRAEQVRDALQTIMKLYGLQGESGTETLYGLLDRAMNTVFDKLQESHEDGLCYDCNTALAYELEREFERYTQPV